MRVKILCIIFLLIVIIALLPTPVCGEAIFSPGDSILYVWFPNYHNSWVYNVIRLRNGGSQIDQAAAYAPGYLLVTDNIPGHLFCRQEFITGARQIHFSTDYGDSWTPLPNQPNRGHVGWGLPGMLPGEASLIGEQYPTYIFCTSNSLNTYDSVEVSQHIPGDSLTVFLGGNTYEPGVLYGMHGYVGNYTWCISSDTGHTWILGGERSRESYAGFRAGAPDELWGFDGPHYYVFLLQDTGRTVRDSVFVPHPPGYPNEREWYPDLFGGRNPGEAYLLLVSDDWTYQDLICYHIQDYGAQVDSFCYQLYHYALSATALQPPSPNRFLLTAAPNPFNAATTIRYSLNKTGPAELSIFNSLGQRAAVLFSGVQEVGEHRISWDASGFRSGIYFARLESAATSQTVKMILLK